jgi:regulator of replication initiation timing
VRILVLIFSLVIGLSVSGPLRAQDPGAQQDAQAAREKLLKAADQLDNIQSNSEATKASVDNMKAVITKLQTDVTQLQADNAGFKQEVADLKTAFDKAEAAHAKERQVLIDSVADLIKQSGSPKSTPKKKPETPAPTPAKTHETEKAPATAEASSTPENLTPPADKPPSDPAPTPDDTPPAKPQKGYYHIVAAGETLTLICNAYRQDGVNVSVAEVRKANGLTDKSVLKVGQKLFIPKPVN